ncbi:MAG TPA: hypothetical protein VGK03_12105 [Geothrix sp.]
MAKKLFTEARSKALGCPSRARDLEVFLAIPKDAQARSLPAADLLQNRRYKATLTQDHKTGRLPAELRARLLKGEYGA